MPPESVSRVPEGRLARVGTLIRIILQKKHYFEKHSFFGKVVHCTTFF